jgi:hypothetical protein
MQGTLSTIEAKQLVRLCKTGRLFDVENWITSGNSLCVPPDLKTTPLEVALGTGFHSLVELLVRNEVDQNLKNRALRRSVSQKRLDFIELLVLHGADISSVPFIEVLLNWEPSIIRYFIEHGADFIKDSPFAVAFGERIRTALRPWRECKERYPEFACQLQEQADRALRHFCFRGDLKWVSLLMWIGADPRSSGPTLDDDYDDESEQLTTLLAATYSEDLQILKRLKPDPEIDNIDELLKTAARLAHADLVKYLLDLGAQPNDKLNCGSTALANCLESFRYGSFRVTSYFLDYGHSRSKSSLYQVSATRTAIKYLLESGALWCPDDADQVTQVRRSLLECEPEVTSELVELLMKHVACSQDVIHDLLRTSAMKTHLRPVVRKLRLLGFDVRSSEQKALDKRQKEASLEWALHNLASKYDREEIYKEIWLEPIQHVAKKYNLSDVGLAKVCRKLNIPRPGRGYWAIKAAGKPTPRQPPLPKLST